MCGPTDLMARGDAKKAARVNYARSSECWRQDRMPTKVFTTFCNVLVRYALFSLCLCMSLHQTYFPLNLCAGRSPPECSSLLFVNDVWRNRCLDFEL